MPKQATGELRWTNSVAVARVTLRGRERATFQLPTCRTEPEAAERAKLIAAIAKRMQQANVEVGLARKVLDQIAAATPRALRIEVALAEEILGGKLRNAGMAEAPTFKQIGERWTSGELAKQYPDQIRVKRSAHNDVSRLTIHVYPVIGAIPIDQLTLDACEDVMRRLPAELATATRRNIGQLITRLLSIATYPLRLFAQAAKLRKEVVPQPDVILGAEANSSPLQLVMFGGAAGGGDVEESGSSQQATQGCRSTGRHPWAWLMKRVYDKDLSVCPRCSGRMSLREVAVTPEAITRVLAQHELWPRPPPPAPPRTWVDPAQVTLRFA